MLNPTPITPEDTPKIAKKTAEINAIKLLPKLIDAFHWNQPAAIAELSESIASTLDTNHPAVAKTIRLRAGQQLRPTHLTIKPDHLISFEKAAHGFEAVILSAQVELECRAIVQEHHRRDELAAYGLQPRHRVLLYGEPGNGKTMLAEALAFELGVPFLRVKYSGLVESFMGATSKNIETIMEYARTAPCLLFLDEFDGIGMDRNDTKDVGEMRRVTNQLLISLERLPSSCFFVGATNAPSLIDSALKRRFDFMIDIPAPTFELKLRCARKELDPSITPGFDVLGHAESIASMPLPNLYAVVELCRRVRRDLVLSGGQTIDSLLASSSLV